jgi:acetyltransferase-like isoleucine patch superfamily enzyme
MSRLRAALAATWRHTPALRAWRHAARYPGLAVSPLANVEIAGRFDYGFGCQVSEGANLLVPAGTTLELGDTVFVGRHVELGPGARIAIGDGTSLQDRTLLVGNVQIGRHCLFSLDVLITSGRHHHADRPHWHIRDQDAAVLAGEIAEVVHDRPVEVHDDCWLGVHSVVMPGVVVGKGAVVGANSVVTRDVAPYSVVAGAPAVEVQRRLDWRPPERLSHDDEAHLPYWYSGVGTRRAERAEAGASGLRAAHAFSVALAARPGQPVHVSAMSRSGSTELGHAGVSCRFATSPDGWNEMTFEAQPDAHGLLQFTVEDHAGSDDRWPVRLREIRLG